MLTSRYMTSVKNLPAIMQKIVEGTAPAKFTISHLKSIGFKSSNDESVIPILKDLGFLLPDGTPTKRYLDYRDQSRSKAIMAEAIRETYEDLFHINEHPSDKDRAAIEGKFRSTHNVKDSVASKQATTFFALLKLADLAANPKKTHATPQKQEDALAHAAPQPQTQLQSSANIGLSGLHYNIQIHLPATKDVEVYNAIFKSLKEHLVND